MNIRIGNSFSGGFIDYLLFGVLQGKDKTNWPNVLIMGIIWFFLYFFIFTFCIKKFHVGIPGMIVKENQEAEAILNDGPKTGDKLFDESAALINAMGGADNIQTVSACATRLRVSLNDNTIVNDDVFKLLGATGVLKVGGGIQAIFGGKVDIYSQEINDILANTSVISAKNKVTTPKINTTTIKNEKYIVTTVNLDAPVNGTYQNLSQIPDEVFSRKMMGDGFAIIPSDGQIFSPVNGEIISVFKTKHAIGIKTNSGLEILLHLGLDTVELNGKPFEMKAKVGDKVTPQTQLVQMDINQVEKAGKNPIIITLITNSSTNIDQITKETSDDVTVKVHQDVFDVKTK